jgi:hypothetical protein
MNTNDNRFAQAKTFNDLDMRMNEFPFETVTDWAGNTVSLYVNDYELQRKVCITKNAKLKDVIFYYVNGDITYEEGLKWCMENDISLEQFDRWLYGALRKSDNPARVEPKEPWPYRVVAGINRVLEILLNSILEDFI